jgi:putative Mg2+ transporter-C (MgtC) family protein
MRVLSKVRATGLRGQLLLYAPAPGRMGYCVARVGLLRYEEARRPRQLHPRQESGIMFQEFMHELFPDLLPTKYVLRVVVRLAVAAVLGGVIGVERQMDRKRDGMRTHMLVSLGAALFTLVGAEALVGGGEVKMVDISRIVQGVAAGVGFLGAGTIIKLSDQHEVRGLTSAASIWLTAAVGMAAGAGWLWPALVSVGFAWVILYVLHFTEKWHKTPKAAPGPVGTTEQAVAAAGSAKLPGDDGD